MGVFQLSGNLLLEQTNLNQYWDVMLRFIENSMVRSHTSLGTAKSTIHRPDRWWNSSQWSPIMRELLLQAQLNSPIWTAPNSFRIQFSESFRCRRPSTLNYFRTLSWRRKFRTNISILVIFHDFRLEEWELTFFDELFKSHNQFRNICNLKNQNVDTNHT